MKQVYCQIRREWVKATPEELIRQQLIKTMISDLGYPNSGMGVEVSLSRMPHMALYSGKLPNRRADLVCFAPKIHKAYPMYPLLLVECKAVPLTSKVLSQVIGYNHYLRSYYIAVANGVQVKTGWFDSKLGRYEFLESLVPYQDLLRYCTGYKPEIAP